MHRNFINMFCDPIDKQSLNYFSFEQEKDNLLMGIFINKYSGMSYCLFKGIPIFLPHSFPTEFINKYQSDLNKLKTEYKNLIFQSQNKTSSWSFSLEWEEHNNLEMTTTWGMTLESRYEQFLYETQSLNDNLNGKFMLDAGCGNGLLTEYFSNQGLIAIGLDYSTSVFSAEKRRKSTNCCFVQGDLMSPPFKNESFDLIVSNGVLHHTPNTELTFKSVAQTVKQNGKFYVWLYSRKGNIYWKFKRRVFDYLRIVICRLNTTAKRLSVQSISFLLYNLYLLFGKKLDKNTLKIDIYDSVTPRWRFYHTPEEISRWYYESGFGPLSVTSWDSRYGFGAVATKTQLHKTPGDHFIPG